LYKFFDNIVTKRKGSKNNHRPTQVPMKNFSKCAWWFFRNQKNKNKGGRPGE